MMEWYQRYYEILELVGGTEFAIQAFQETFPESDFLSDSKMGLDSELFQWLLKSVCPRAFSTEKCDYKNAIVLDDVLTLLRRMRSDGRKDNFFTGTELFEQYAAILNQQVFRQNIDLYLACCDMPELMPSLKFREQKRRDEAREFEPYPDDAEIGVDGIRVTPEGPFARFDLQRVLSSREKVRGKLMQFLEDRFW